MRACGGNGDAQVGLRARYGRNGRLYLQEANANKTVPPESSFSCVEAAQTAASREKKLAFSGGTPRLTRPACLAVRRNSASKSEAAGGTRDRSRDGDYVMGSRSPLPRTERSAPQQKGLAGPLLFGFSRSQKVHLSNGTDCLLALTGQKSEVPVQREVQGREEGYWALKPNILSFLRAECDVEWPERPSVLLESNANKTVPPERRFAAVDAAQTAASKEKSLSFRAAGLASQGL